MNKMDRDLVIRMAVSIVAFINMFANSLGFTPLNLDDNTVYSMISGLIVLGTWAYGFWKNNNFTSAAKAGQRVIDRIKTEEKEAFFNKE